MKHHKDLLQGHLKLMQAKKIRFCILWVALIVCIVLQKK